jgi:Brp/Blh family beta-carotene 15,15'-monooxygenase
MNRLWPATALGTSGGFQKLSFHQLPLAVLATAAAGGALAGSGWSEELAALPWIVSLVLVGLPHGAADFALSRRAWRGWPLVGLWLAYVAVMAGVAIGLVAAPLAAISVFVVLSCWHFGKAHVDSEPFASDWPERVVATLARGCGVLAVPLAAWPGATAGAASELVSLTVSGGRGEQLISVAAVQAAGLILLALTLLAVVVEGMLVIRTPGGGRRWLRLVMDMAVIAALGWFTAPLFSVGLYFLVWHSWRQMEPLAEAITGTIPSSWSQLGRSLVRIHAAALPLLVPTWAALGTAWWLWSAGHTPGDLAVLSIAAYLVVTPAHELLGELLRAGYDTRGGDTL